MISKRTSKSYVISFLLMSLFLVSGKIKYPAYMAKNVTVFKEVTIITFEDFSIASCNNNSTDETIFTYHKDVLVKKELRGCFQHEIVFNKMSEKLESKYKKQLKEYQKKFKKKQK